jgi:hypothetical protein
MKTVLTIAVFWILCAGCASLAEAVCVGTSVHAFGAKGDGHTDDTAAIQSAIDAAATGGGGAVVFNTTRYFTTGSFIVPAGVVLCGSIEGPFDNGTGANPGVTTIAPTLLVTNVSAPFLSLNGVNSGVSDLLFHYPNQVSANASSPAVYPYTILVKASGTKVVRCMTSNAYNFLDIESGKVVARDLYIGAYNIGINVDHATDHVTIRHVLQTVFWDAWEGRFPSTIDTWVMNHGTGFVVNRADSVELHDLALFTRYAGIVVTDSPDTTQSPRCGYGSGGDINFDGVQYGLIATASNSRGYQFSNVTINPLTGLGVDSQAVAQLRSGGSSPPNVLIEGGAVLGPWTLGPFPTPAAGHLKAVNIFGFDLP